jgi:hypothetical protein
MRATPKEIKSLKEFVDNMNFKEKARAKVKELDARMAELNSLYEKETDPKKQREIAKEIYSVMVQTNKFLKMAGADEQEMYMD